MDSLRLDTSMQEDTRRPGLNELFEVVPFFFKVIGGFVSVACTKCELSFHPQFVSEECQHGPLVVFFKEIEKSVAGTSDSYLAMKSKIDSLPAGVLVVCSSTQMDNRKEKVSFIPLVI